MNERVAQLIKQLRLEPHPEGGYFAEDYRSPLRVHWHAADRNAGTHIHYLLRSGEISCWHRIDADEIWHLYEGGPLHLYLLTEDFSFYRLHLAAGEEYRQVVPAGCWQAASCTAPYALVGCTVFPGFEFSQFSLLRDFKEQKERMLELHPEFDRFL